MRTPWLPLLALSLALLLPYTADAQGGGFFRNPFRNFGRRPFRQQSVSSGPYFSWRDRSVGRGAVFTWGQANQRCRSRGQKLISLDSLQKSQAVVNDIGKDRVEFIWTSGRRTGNGWRWANGRGVEPFNWSSTGLEGRAQPDNREGNENCLAVLNNFYQDGIVWHDVACHHEKPFICE